MGLVNPAASDQPASAETPELQQVLRKPVTVAINVARKKMTLGEIASVRVGDTIHFEKECREALEIVINGNLIGAGQAVRIKDTLGLQIKTVCDQHTVIAAMSPR